ncbi:uncharacterized protein LOC122375344 isoform X2 [Amphibalanus amphitrite]|uniref:uncharacterized protein LOC122375344 isoform X2 n=1 Tax=Amphibalanus amphitrite TaxID=1232801 RepID=UPI001C9259EF|nr:uncharacterized protein LOC122375344 isoform X2 [Amphibalanus amphitrite]
MADLEKLKRRKISAQGWLTRTVVKLEQSLSLKEVKVIDLESLLCDFDKRLSDFDVAEELLEQELPEDGIMEAIEAAGEIRDRAVDVRNKAQQTLGVLKVKDGADDSASCASASQLGSADPSVKLPKLQLPKFSGNVLEWPQFWDAFSVTVDASDLPEVTKLTYLRSLLTGEAAKSVEGLALSKVNYKTTCEILKDRFGRKEQIIYNHIQALLQSSCDKKSEGLKSFQDELLVHVRSLENLDITGERYGVVLTPIIVSRLPEVIRMEWARKSAGKEADLEFLLEFLKEEIQCRERSQTFKCGAMASDSGRETEKKRDHQAGRFAGQRQRVAAASVLHTAAARSNCGICHDSHPPAKCPELLKLAVRDRPGKIRDSDPAVVRVEAAEVPVICSPLARPSVPSSLLALFGNLELADPPGDGGELTVDILIGLDYYWQLMGTGCLRSDLGPVAQQTVFGWIISGQYECANSQNSSGTQLLVMSDVSEERLRQFWDLDAIGIKPLDDDIGSDPVLKEFESSVCFKEGRYEVKLPWKPDGQDKLMDNRKTAEVRLRSLTRKLEKDPQLQSDYDHALEELEAEGIITEVSCDADDAFPVFYLPHRPVVRQSSVTTKVRPVFDASAKGPNLVSLNDCLETGPCLLPDLVQVLLRFRRWKFAVSADIRKAFLMVQLCDKDQEVHRFLWQHGDRIRTMKFCRVTFGVNCSPFLLSATIRHHLKGFPPSNTVSELEENLYVDDFLSGADTEPKACALFAEARDVLGQAGMTLTKLNSNSRVVLDKGPALSSLDGESHKVLGVQWDPSQDVLSFEGVDIPSDIAVTKRVILSFIARLFDPLGLLTPYIMTVKRLFQETWRLGLDWDDNVPEHVRVRFLRWLDGLSYVKSISVPRSYCVKGWHDVHVVEVHAFGDASEVGYGAAVYLRLTLRDGSVVTPLVMSRARVAPLKQVSLPRLELLASLLAARLLRFVCRALKLPSETLYWCWTDSMVSLGWIKGDPSRWKQFVKNRVIEIQSLTDPAQWSHCPGQDNPADLITRGVYAEALTDSPWFSGPDWLSDCAGADLLSSPEVLLPESELFSAAEGEPAAAAVESASADVSSSPESELFVAAEGQLAAAAATSDCSQPVFEHELLKHCGVDTLLTTLRNEYWIVGGRRAAKRVKRACTACQRQDAAALNAPVAPLPAQRASKAPPFSVTGVDFCGPLFCLPKQKVYVCLFTCAVTRAIHLELTDSMSQSEFLLAFRRFCARRGTPTMMYSDNAKTFRAAATSLLAELGPAGPEWKFIAPRAAWWGGHWERLVRTVKSSLRKTLGRSVLSKVELETLLLEVEACVNSRPLTFVSDDVDGARPLTPSHFLSGRVAGVRAFVVDDSDQVSASSLTERDVEHQNMLAKFWSVWQTDYLRSLPHSVKKFKSRGKLQIGSVVLIREDNVPRLHWLMGVVEHLHPGSDGVVRAADVRTAQGVRTRPVQRLHDLEVLD